MFVGHMIEAHHINVFPMTFLKYKFINEKKVRRYEKLLRKIKRVSMNFMIVVSLKSYNISLTYVRSPSHQCISHDIFEVQNH